MADSHRESELCLRVAGKPPSPPACATLREIVRENVERAHQLEVTTAEIAAGMIEVQLVEAGKTVLKGRFRPPGWPKTTALCGGLIVQIVDDGRDVAELSVYLDDP